MLSSLRRQLFVYPKLHRLLSDALRHETLRIGPEQARFVADYIDCNEFGLAREQLIDALDELGLLPTGETTLLLDKAAKLMGPTR